MKRSIICLCFILAANNSFAQQQGRMETDRPDQTESPYLTKKNWVQAEVGFNIEKDNGLKTFVHPTALLKYGLNKRFEFRLITTWVSRQLPLTTPKGNDYETGLLPVQVGGKIFLFEEKGLLPKTSLIFHVAPNKFGSKNFITQNGRLISGL